MAKIRVMNVEDMAFNLRMTQEAGWNQTEEDWARFLSLEPDGCFVAEIDGVPAGTVTTCRFKEIGWVGMLLVHEGARRQGLGRQLMNAAIGHLETRDVTTVRLDATPLGEPLYRQLGFREQFNLTRYVGSIRPTPADSKLEPITSDNQPQVFTLDREVSRCDRTNLLYSLLHQPVESLVVQQGKGVDGFLCSRPGRIGTYVGPCIAKSTNTGERLLKALGQLSFKDRFVIDVPDDNMPATQTILSMGFQPARQLLRMNRGSEVLENIQYLWASSGPETG